MNKTTKVFFIDKNLVEVWEEREEGTLENVTIEATKESEAQFLLELLNDKVKRFTENEVKAPRVFSSKDINQEDDAKKFALFLELDETLYDIENKIDDEDYLVLTDDEADQKTREDIEQLLWAFNSDFLADMTDMPSEIFEALSEKYENANDAVLACIEKTCGLDEFVKAAIAADGRGHFLASYDGHENEQMVNGETFFIYRRN